MNNNRPKPSRIRIRPEGPTPSVDGHPGWVTQSVRQYILLCGITIGMHSLIAGASIVLTNARSAAWWVTALGSLGGLLTWIPIWGMTKGNEATSVDEALKEAYGKVGASIVMLMYTVVALYHAGIAIFIIGSFVRHYLIVGANVTVVSIAVLVILSFSIYRFGTRGLSRLAWLLRFVILFAMATSCAVSIQYTYIENLFPVLGNDLPNTAYSLLVSASCYVPVLSLGILPLQTGSAKPVRFRTGLKALGIGCAISTFLMLFINLSMPPQAVDTNIIWGYNLALSVEYMSSHMIRLLYFLMLFTMLFLSGTNSIGLSIAFVRSIWSQKNNAVYIIIFLILLVTLVLLSSSEFAKSYMHLMIWRLPIAAVPAWASWGVLSIVRKRRAKA